MRLSLRLTWLFAALFLLCGLPLLLFGKEGDDSGAANALAGSATFFLGAFGLCLAWNAWETGAVNLQHFHYTRAGQPRRFVATVGMIFTAGCGALVTAVWFFFFK